jgi:DNA polymerase V
VIPRSEEAKRLGIQMGTPAFMVEEFLQKNNVTVFSSNYTLYGSLSNRVMGTLQFFSPKIEVYSIDEAFVDLTDFIGIDLMQYGIKIKETVKQNIGIPVTIGIAPTKALAKLASRFAKKNKKEIGVHVLDTQDKIDEVLEWTEIGDVWGIGKQHKKRLLMMNVKTAAQFIKVNHEWIKRYMTVVGERLFSELMGIPCIEWEDVPQPKQGICVARSFGQLLSSKQEIKEAAANYANSCAVKLRKQKSCATSIHVLLHTNEHRTQDNQYYRSITLQLSVPTNSSQEIIKYALKAIDMIYKPGYNFKKAGVMVLDLVPESQVQGSLFDNQNRSRDKKLMKALDSVNVSFGKDLVRFAVQGYGRKWKLRQERLSPCYTTNLNQVMQIKK